MLQRLPRHVAFIGLLAPAGLLLSSSLVTALSVGGCVRDAEPHDTRLASAALAKVPSPWAKELRAPHSERSARSLSIGSVASSTLAFASVGRAGALGNRDGRTPLEVLLREGDRPLGMNGLCPPDMASIDDAYCIDRYEASLLEVLPNGDERAYSSFEPLGSGSVRAVSEPKVFPRGYISERQAAAACSLSGKRLCKPREWVRACMGPEPSRYGYGNANEPHRCNDDGQSPIRALYSSTVTGEGDRTPWGWDKMNAPALNQLDKTLARTGDHPGCTNGYGVYDMVGNLHEWVDDPSGTFQGGYYQDTHLNGDGCSYKTTAHAAWYHDYSTGFRCCADVAP